MKIIVIDDEKASLNLFVQDFVIDNYEMEWYCFQNNPEKAIELAEKSKVDVAFLDINMPEISGIELAKELIRINDKIRIVFISGYEQDEASLKDTIGENFVGLYSKPYSRDELRLILDVIIYENTKNIEIRCFGRFNVFVNGEAVNFESKKSKEILAVLADAGGGFVSMDAVIGHVWPDKDIDSAKRAYKDNVYRLRKTLKIYGIEDIVEYGKAKLCLHTDNIRCDYWNYKAGLSDAPTDEYMLDYDWSDERREFIWQLRS